MSATPDGRAVHDAVAHAAGLRDRATRRRRVWGAAPILAILFLLLAIAGRLTGASPLVSLGAGAVLAAALAAYALLPRRADGVSDAAATALDDRATLGGELRSAHWFAAQSDAGAWVAYHLSRAAQRIGGAPWDDLYAPPRRPRAYATTAVLAVAAIIVAVVGPTTRAALAPGGDEQSRLAGGQRVITATEIEQQLAELLARLEAGEAASGRTVTAADVRDLLERLKNAERQSHGKSGKDLDDKLRSRVDRAAKDASLDPDVRDALEDLKNALPAARDQNAKTSEQQGSPTGKADASGADAKQQSGNATDSKDVAGAQIVSDAQPGAGAGIVAMTSEPPGSPKQAGLGMGGGDGGAPTGGAMVDLRAALRREMIESGAGQAAGAPPENDLRHKTDRGTASVGFSRGAAAAAVRGRVNAATVIPEARRPATRAYFQRKQ